MERKTDRIRGLNDALRQHHAGGAILVTRGIKELGANLIRALDEAVSAYDGFDSANDPYDEHDFGSVKVAGYTVFFKIDYYYDFELSGHSPDPADPSLTNRFLTIMLAQEY